MAEAKQEKASSRGTGLFDYEMLQSLQAIQGGISDLKDSIKKQEEKPYEEARERLKLRLPKAPPLPKIPNPANLIPSVGRLGDLALDAAKLALAGAFLVGLLKETLVKWFDSIEFDSASFGGLIGNALKDLLTEQPGEESLKQRFAKAFKFGLKTAVYGGAAGFIVGGPIGAVAGAIIGFAGGALYSMLESDKGTDAQALVEDIKARFRKAAAWAALGALAGVSIAVLTPVGIVTAAIVGAVAMGIFAFFSKNEDKHQKRIDRIMEKNFELGFFDDFGNFLKNTFVGMRNAFNKFKAQQILKMNPGTYSTLEDVYKDRPDLLPQVGDTMEIRQLQKQIARRRFELGQTFTTVPNNPKEVDNLSDMQKHLVPYTMPANAGWWNISDLSQLARKSLDSSGKRFTQQRVPRPGEQVFVPEKYLPMLNSFEEVGAQTEKLYNLQLKHHKENRGAEPDIVPPTIIKPDETSSLDPGIKSDNMSLAAQQLMGVGAASLQNGNPPNVNVILDNKSLATSGGNEGQGGLELAMISGYSGDKKNDGLQSSFFGFAPLA